MFKLRLFFDPLTDKDMRGRVVCLYPEPMAINHFGQQRFVANYIHISCLQILHLCTSSRQRTLLSFYNLSSFSTMFSSYLCSVDDISYFKTQVFVYYHPPTVALPSVLYRKVLGQYLPRLIAIEQT